MCYVLGPSSNNLCCLRLLHAGWNLCLQWMHPGVQKSITDESWPCVEKCSIPICLEKGGRFVKEWGTVCEDAGWKPIYAGGQTDKSLRSHDPHFGRLSTFLRPFIPQGQSCHRHLFYRRGIMLSTALAQCLVTYSKENGTASLSWMNSSFPHFIWTYADKRTWN